MMSLADPWKTEISEEEYRKLKPNQQLDLIRDVCKEAAERCRGNMLLSGWVAESFDGIGHRLDEIAFRLKVVEFQEEVEKLKP